MAGLIDLGTLEPTGPEGRPAPHWRGGWWDQHRRIARRWGQLLLVVSLILSLSAAAPPAPRLAPLWTDTALSLSGTAQWSRPVADGPHLYALTPVASGGVALLAHRLRDGQLAWRARLAASGNGSFILRVAGGVPVVTAFGARTAAYDPGTGRPLWRRVGMPWREIGGRLLLTATAADGRGEVVTAIDPGTGDAVGSATWPAGQVAAPWLAGDGTLHLFTLGPDGTLTRRPLTSDGQARAAAPRPGDGAARAGSLRLVDGLVVAIARTGDRRGVVAYDTGTLRRRWWVPGGYGVSPCGPVVCVRVTGSAGRYDSVRGVDPASGTTRWAVSCADAGLTGRPCTLSAVSVGPGDRLWVEMVVPDRYTHGSLATSWIADTRTGDRLTDTVRWSLRQELGELGKQLLLSRADRQRAPGRPARPRTVWWALADDGPGVDVLGSVPANACTPHHPYLVCWTEGEGVTVWRISS